MLPILSKLILAITFILIVDVNMLPAQSVWSVKRNNNNWMIEPGYTIGTSNYFVGDLVPSFFSLKDMHLSGSLFCRYYPSKYVSFVSAMSYATISGRDAGWGKYPYRAIRNLSFKSNILEWNVSTEINLIGYQPVIHNHKFSPYITIGLGVFHFNPKSYYGGQWYALQPLGTEGQGIPGFKDRYKRVQICVPFGGGLKFGFNPYKEHYFTVHIEAVLRKTTTDYLDDVSTNYVPLELLKKYNGDLSAELSIRADEYYGYPITSNFDVRRGSPKYKDYYLISNIGIAYIFHHEEYQYIYKKKKNKF
jgi:hypothetical protein